MEGVDHVHVVEIGRRGLVGEVDRVLERQVPDREGLELGIAGLDAAPVLVIELAQAGGHLAAARAGRGHDDEGALGLDVIVLSEAVVRDDQRDVGGIIRDDIVPVGLDAQRLEPLHELVGDGLAAVVRHDDAADIQPDAAEGVDQPQRVVLVGDAEVAAALAALDVVGGDGDDDLGHVLHLEEHAHLAVRLEAGEHARGVIVVEELAAELQIQLAAEMGDAVADVLRLELDVFVVVKSRSCHILTSFSPYTPTPTGLPRKTQAERYLCVQSARCVRSRKLPPLAVLK